MDAIGQALGADMSRVAGPAWVTLAYVGIYYAFMTNVLRIKVRLHFRYKADGEAFDRYHTRDREMLAADRTQLNMLEHMPIFLTLLWLHAFVVSSYEATILGGIYTGTRALYPILLGGRMGRQVPARIVPVTLTGYVVLTIFAVRIAMSL